MTLFSTRINKKILTIKDEDDANDGHDANDHEATWLASIIYEISDNIFVIGDIIFFWANGMKSSPWLA